MRLFYGDSACICKWHLLSYVCAANSRSYSRKVDMNKQKGYTAIELLMAIAFLAMIGIGGGILYAVFHFIGKFW